MKFVYVYNKFDWYNQNTERRNQGRINVLIGQTSTKESLFTQNAVIFAYITLLHRALTSRSIVSKYASGS